MQSLTTDYSSTESLRRCTVDGATVQLARPTSWRHCVTSVLHFFLPNNTELYYLLRCRYGCYTLSVTVIAYSLPIIVLWYFIQH